MPGSGRISSCLEPVPLMTKPTVTALAPVPTKDRIERFMILADPVGPPPPLVPVTVRVAASLTLDPARFSSWARNSSPFIDVDAAVTVSVAVVAPPKVPLLPTLLQVEPPSSDSCHW
jgi:hypothetical protein